MANSSLFVTHEKCHVKLFYNDSTRDTPKLVRETPCTEGYYYTLDKDSTFVTEVLKTLLHQCLQVVNQLTYKVWILFFWVPMPVSKSNIHDICFKFWIGNVGNTFSSNLDIIMDLHPKSQKSFECLLWIYQFILAFALIPYIDRWTLFAIRAILGNWSRHWLWLDN